MKNILALIFLFYSIAILSQDLHFPIKINKKWGLMDANGSLFLSPVYDAVGHFTKGYAITQLNGKTGLIDKFGNEVFTPKYQDIRVLDSLLFSVFENNLWRVVNKKGVTVLDQEYDEIQVLNDRFIAFAKNNKWGAVHLTGKLIAEPVYENIEVFENKFLWLNDGNNINLLKEDGTLILTTQNKKVTLCSDNLIFYKEEEHWGAIDTEGKEVLPTIYDNWSVISSDFIKLKANKSTSLFSNVTNHIVSEDEFYDFRFFVPNIVYTQLNFKVGLMNTMGEIIVPTIFDEIQTYDFEQLYRVNKNGKWGLFKTGGKMLIPANYDFIGPPSTSTAVVRNNNKLGIINLKGELQTKIVYDRINLEENVAKAYNDGTLNLITFSEEGILKEDDHFENFGTLTIGYKGKRNTDLLSGGRGPDNPYLLKNFEWYYHEATSKWGLRDRHSGKIVIPPTYFQVNVRKDLGFTIVATERVSLQTFDRTSFMYYFTYGIINNEFGKPSTQFDLLDLRMEDFDNDKIPAARCIFSNGKHGLISKRGGTLLKDYAFIGDFHDGLARISIKGVMTVNLPKDEYHLGGLKRYLSRLDAPSQLESITNYDLQMEQEGVINVKNGVWGFMDTLGNIVIQPQFEYVSNFKNGVSIIKINNKWGTINTNGEIVLEPKFDKIHFVSNSRDSILRIYQTCKKYGMVDSLGNLILDVKFDKVGPISQNRIPVKLGTKWGFANNHGDLVTAIKYEKVQPFNEGLAAVRLKRKWGFINTNGDLVIEHKFRRIGDFSEGKAWAAISSLIGFINTSGEFIVEPQFHQTFNFQDGLAIVRISNEYGIIDKTGKYIVNPKYKKIEPFSKEGLAIVHYKATQSYGLINQKGEKICRQKFEGIKSFSNGMAAIRQHGKYGFIDTSGQIVVHPIYNRVEDYSENRARFIQKGRWGYLNKEGDVVIEPIFSKCLDFKQGKAVVYKGYRNSGLITTSGEYLIQPHLSSILSFDEGRGLVRTRSHSHYFITDDEKLYKGYYQEAQPFKYGVAPVKYNNRWGLISRRGIELIAPKYHEFSKFENGYASVQINNFSGVAALDGKILIKPEFEYIIYVGEGLFRVEHGDSIGYFDTTANWVWPLQE